MLNDISENVLSNNHKVKIVNFPGDTNEKILGKLDNLIKQNPDDLMLELMMSLIM